jgi:hypothetical protein
MVQNLISMLPNPRYGFSLLKIAMGYGVWDIYIDLLQTDLGNEKIYGLLESMGYLG